MNVGDASATTAGEGTERQFSGINLDGSVANTTPDWMVTDFTLDDEVSQVYWGEIGAILKDYFNLPYDPFDYESLIN